MKPAFAPGLVTLSASFVIFVFALQRAAVIALGNEITYLIPVLSLMGLGLGTASVCNRWTSSSSPKEALHDAAPYALALIVVHAITIRVSMDGASASGIALGAGLAILPAIFLGRAWSRMTDVFSLHWCGILFGAAFGATLAPSLVDSLGASAALVIAALVASVAVVITSVSAPKKARTFALLSTLIVLGGGAMNFNAPLRLAPTHSLAQLDTSLIDQRHPSDVGEVLLSHVSDDLPPLFSGDAPKGTTAQRGRFMGVDGEARGTIFTNLDGLDRSHFLGRSQAAAPYIVLGVSAVRDPRVLLLGLNCGAELMTAHAHGIENITVTEENAAVIRTLFDDLKPELGSVFQRKTADSSEGLSVRWSNGHSRGDRGSSSFHIIHVGRHTGRYLESVAGLKSLYTDLAEGGLLHYSHPIVLDPKKPLDNLRFAAKTRRALEEIGVEDPGAQVLVFVGREWSSTIIKRGAFTIQEIDALQRAGGREGYIGFIYNPLLRNDVEAYAPKAEAEDFFARVVLAVGEENINKNLGTRLDLQEMSEHMRLAFRYRMQNQRRDAMMLITGWLDQDESIDSTELRGHVLTQINELIGVSVDAEFDRHSAFVAEQDLFRAIIALGLDDQQDVAADHKIDLAAITGDLDLPDGPLPSRSIPVQSTLWAVAILSALLAMFLAMGHRPQGSPAIATPLAIFGLALSFAFVGVALSEPMTHFLGRGTFDLSIFGLCALGTAALGALVAARQRFQRRSHRLVGGITVAVGTAWLIIGLRMVLPSVDDTGLVTRIGIALAVTAPLFFGLGILFVASTPILSKDDETPAISPAMAFLGASLGWALCLIHGETLALRAVSAVDLAATLAMASALLAILSAKQAR